VITWASFIADFPEFDPAQLPPVGDPNPFGQSAFAFWLNLATMLLNQYRWGSPSAVASSPPATLVDVGYELFVAHNLVLEKQAYDTAIRGGAPGITTGPVASKTINGVSVSYDVSAGLNGGDGHWNLTTFGIRFVSLVNMVGAGGVQL
jgi:Protein of unknown function (DUF4054)